jgi:3-hydroxyacyl-[acyl-carrier-protein] dehydratase
MSSDVAVDPQLLQRIKAIVRRDLKLGPTALIADDMPFFNSEADLDSLDILLLVTSVEKEFGVKIPSAEVGRTVFENPLTLTRYVQGLRNATSAPRAASGSAESPADALAKLPHRDPFRFVSRVTRVESGKSATGVWDVSGNEPFFAGHFPGRPVVPGVLLAEALAQTAGIAGAEETTSGGALVHVDVRFTQAVAPPASIQLSAMLTRKMGQLAQFDVVATVNGAEVARGGLTLHLASAASPAT